MVHADPDRNFSLRIFAYHLYEPSTKRFSHVNGKQSPCPTIIIFTTFLDVALNNRAARAARTYVEFFDVVCQTPTWNSQIKGLNEDVNTQQ